MNKTRNLRIKDIFNVVSGATPSSKVESFWDGDVIWVTPADMTDFGYIESGSNNITLEGYNSCGTQYVPKGSIIISSRAPIGKINIAQNKLCTNQGCKSLVLSTKEVNSKYVAYYLYNVVEEINSLGQGTTFNELPLKRLVSFNVKLPSKDEQQRIVDYLDEKLSAIDKRVENLEKQKNAYARLKKSVIYQAVTRGLNPNVPLKDSGIKWIGMIPYKWNTRRFKNVFNKSNVGESIDKEYNSDNLEDILFYTAGLNPIHSTFVDFPQWKLTNSRDILLARNGTPYVYLPICNSIYSDHIIRVDIRKEYCKEYVKYCLQEAISNVIVDSVSIATWSISVWEKQVIPTPPLSEQKAIAKYLDEKCSKIEAAIENINKQIDASKRLKRALINEVITGHRAV